MSCQRHPCTHQIMLRCIINEDRPEQDMYKKGEKNTLLIVCIFTMLSTQKKHQIHTNTKSLHRKTIAC